jgi:hypothetical protein
LISLLKIGGWGWGAYNMWGEASHKGSGTPKQKPKGN